MARKSDKEILRKWRGEVTAAEKAYRKWAEKYRTERPEEFYHGLQWPFRQDDLSGENEQYVINLFFPAIETKRPSLLFYHPKYSIQARPTRLNDPQTDAEARAQLREDTVNTMVGMPDLAFRAKTGLALLEALFTYGIIEVGYTADFIDNPNAGKPVLADDGSEDKDAEGNPIQQPERIPERERLFLKRIPAKTFRVGMNGKNAMRENDWVGYYEWHHPSDLRANPQYSNTAGLKTTGSVSNDLAPATEGMVGGKEPTEEERYRGMVKVWKIWDLRGKKRLVFPDNGDAFLMKKPFKFLPFAPLKFKEILDEWYPFPITFNWTWPQMELNETRQMQRIHRQRFKRKFVRTGALTPEEAAKLANGDDGTIVEAATLDCIRPVEDAGLDAAVRYNLPETKTDFNEITGVTAEQRGVAESSTATQSNILDVRSRIRESLERTDVGEWLADIGRLMLMTIEESMSLPMWVKTVVDPQSASAPMLTRQVEAVWRQITAEDLGDMDYDITVDVESLSPATEFQQRQDWNQFLATVMTQPILIQVFALSPTMLRKTARLNGIKNEKDLQELERVIPMLAQAMAAAQQAQQAAKHGGAPGQATPGPTPNPQDIMQQLGAQMPGQQAVI